MFLKGIKDKFKYKSAAKVLKELMRNPLPVAQRSAGISSIGSVSYTHLTLPTILLV